MKAIKQLLIFASLSAMILSTPARSNTPDTASPISLLNGAFFSSRTSHSVANQSIGGDIEPLQRQEIRRIQAALNRHRLAVAIDGVWGPKTEAALYKFEKGRGLLRSNLIDRSVAQQLGLSEENKSGIPVQKIRGDRF